ncbi:MAG TPA: NAD-dependent epimerase/dehydratase family protein, partial [Terriglobales bacterium]|nr:NAD-dependent epimerase/dehydratase family protein [Terriglobales bacterium]
HPPRDESPAVLNFCYHAMTNILEAAKEIKVQRVVYASSGALYGQLRRRDHTPIREDHPVAIYPTYFYRSAKILSEWLGDFYKETHHVDFVALRFSSVYGPGLGRGIPLELKKGMLGQNCRPYLTRLPDDLIYIDDVTDAIQRALFSTKALSRAYNIAMDQAYEEKDLQHAIEQALPELSFTIGKHPNAAVTGIHRDRDLLDITLARRDLEFDPKVGLGQGIARIVAWLKEHADHLE